MYSDGAEGKGKVVSFLMATMRGISQVLLIENWLTGLLILAAITITKVELGVIAFLSSAIGTLIGQLGGGYPMSVRRGLYGYNPMLAGVALLLYLEGPERWGIALFGAVIAAVANASLLTLLKPTGMPTLTTPYVIITWLMLIASYKLEAFEVTDEIVPQDLSNWQLNIAGEMHWFDAFLNGAGQIFFLKGMVAGLLIFIGIFIAGMKFGLYALAGNLIAMLFAYYLGGEHKLINEGLYGYNAILTSIAVGVVFQQNRNRFAPLTAIIGVIFSVPLSVSITVVLLPLGLPALTMPFALITSILIGARKSMQNI